MAEKKEIKTELEQKEAQGAPATEPRTDLNEAAPVPQAEGKTDEGEEEVGEEVLPEAERTGDKDTPSDQGMEAPKTKQYNGPDRLVRLTPLFREELEAAIGELPYAYKMGTPERNIEVNQLFKIVREHGDHLQIPQLNELMGLINLAPWKLIHTFTEHVSSQETQKNYLEVYDPRAEEEGKKE